MSDETRDSTPVTFAAVLAYHRKRAQDWRSADRPWHEEAVECLRELAEALKLLAGQVSEVARLLEQVAEEHAAWAGVTDRLALGTLPDAQVLSPLSVSPAEPMLICPSCQCAWPGLMPGRDDTVTCSCGRLLGCAMRDR